MACHAHYDVYRDPLNTTVSYAYLFRKRFPDSCIYLFEKMGCRVDQIPSELSKDKKTTLNNFLPWQPNGILVHSQLGKRDPRMPIANALQNLIAEYIASPFRYIRESTVQARLFELINLELEPEHRNVGCVPVMHPPRPNFHYANNLHTMRTQLEMKIGQCQCPKHGKTDILLLRDDAPVHLTLHPNGPVDVIASICADDVRAAVEIKMSPSSMGAQRLLYRDDVSKLITLSQGHPMIQGYFLLLDTALAIPGVAEANPILQEDWIVPLPLQMHDQRPDNQISVEIWDIAPGLPLQPRVRYYG